MTGSRILSRSFHVLRWKADGEDPDEEVEVDETDAKSALNPDSNAMDVDAVSGDGDEAPTEAVAREHAEEATEADDEDDDDDDRYEDPADVAMVPMADMLNGRFATETVSALCPEVVFMTNIHVRRGFITTTSIS